MGRESTTLSVTFLRYVHKVSPRAIIYEWTKVIFETFEILPTYLHFNKSLNFPDSFLYPLVTRGNQRRKD